MKIRLALVFGISGCLGGFASAAELEVNQLLRVQGGVEISTSDTGAPAIFASSITNPGNVGIGNANPSTKLDVAGTMSALDISCPACTVMQRRVTGSCATGYVIRQINQDGTVECETGTPPSVIVLSTTTCLAGFQELTSFAGRLVKGMPAVGTLAGTVGTPMTDLATFSHNHTGATGNVDLAHTHDFDPPNTTSGGQSAGDVVYSDYRGGSSCGGSLGRSDHTHNTDIANLGSSAASVSMAHTHTISANDHTQPYIQVRVCMKN